MKDNKVLSAAYGIALFVALVGVVGLFYNGIEMLCYTTFYSEHNNSIFIQEAYTNLQKPIAITVLIAGILGMAGVCAGVLNLFVKKPVSKYICLACIGAAFLDVLASVIAVSAVWKSQYFGAGYKWTGWGMPYFVGGLSNSENQIFAQAYTIYSASLSSLIQNLVCFAVIVAVPVYEFVRDIIKGKKNYNAAAGEEVAVAENDNI